MSVEIREVNGSLDEVVGPAKHFHLEQMDNGHWWIGVECPNGDIVHINLYTKRNARIFARVEVDTFDEQIP